MSLPVPESKNIQAYISNRYAVLAEDQDQQQKDKTIYDLQKLKSMKMNQLKPLAKSLKLSGIHNKRKHDLCMLIANALGIRNINEEKITLEESTITIDMTITPNFPTTRKKRAMTSEKASMVKKDGHKNQDRFAEIMNGIKSDDHTGKIDIRVQEKTYSLKKECKRIQFALYTISSRRWRNRSTMTDMCKLCLSVFPIKFYEYKRDTERYKKLLGERMKCLKESCKNKSNLKELLEIFIRGRSNEVQYVVFNFKGEDYIFQADEMIDKIIQNTTIHTSSKKTITSEDAQKVIIRNQHNIIEMEIRKSSETHYREFLCVANRDKLVNLLISAIPNKAYHKQNVLLLGKAIQQHLQT